MTDFLNNNIRSAQLGLPVYKLSGTSGFVYVASFNQKGKGNRRFFAADPSQLERLVLPEVSQSDDRTTSNNGGAPSSTEQKPGEHGLSPTQNIGCQSIANPADRLICYDAVAKASSATQLPPKSENAKAPPESEAARAEAEKERPTDQPNPPQAQSFPQNNAPPEKSASQPSNEPPPPTGSKKHERKSRPFTRSTLPRVYVSKIQEQKVA